MKKTKKKCTRKMKKGKNEKRGKSKRVKEK